MGFNLDFKGLRVLYVFVFRFSDSRKINDNNNNNNNKVKTDRAVQNNTLDIAICDSDRGTCQLLGFAVSADINMFKKETKICVNTRTSE
jgi:hypothetical protein